MVNLSEINLYEIDNALDSIRDILKSQAKKGEEIFIIKDFDYSIEFDNAEKKDMIIGDMILIEESSRVEKLVDIDDFLKDYMLVE